ncbi:hypothetical protein Ccrd_026557 [Cynara cardunculus var. scolymus]|uniref:Uncharacterized protein n=1 Tax=Cynara cardunculus var. scolymus TaxID=59895 RepID=A0A103NKT3_CYNCS|nr:hypothetical protein Ccrd_026557 [Cynara cardunculus var. scolymus]
MPSQRAPNAFSILLPLCFVVDVVEEEVYENGVKPRDIDLVMTIVGHYSKREALMWSISMFEVIFILRKELITNKTGAKGILYKVKAKVPKMGSNNP